MAAALTEVVKARIKRATRDLGIILTENRLECGMWNESRTRTGQVKEKKIAEKEQKIECEAPVL